MNRMIKLFQQKSNRKFDEYLAAKKRLENSNPPPTAEGLSAAICSVLKTESDTWAKAAELLRKEELSK